MKFEQLLTLLKEDVYPVEGESLDSAVKRLDDQGWKEIGNGSFGRVFGHPDKSYVIKIYNDDAYDNYIDFIKKHSSNPHVVKIKEIMPNGFGARNKNRMIAIEKLVPIKNSTWRECIADYYGSFLNNNYSKDLEFYESLQKFEEYVLNKRLERDIDFYKKTKNTKNALSLSKIRKRLGFFIENNLDLFRIMYQLDNFRNQNTTFDLHKGNYMIRPSTGEIVVTDPLC